MWGGGPSGRIIIAPSWSAGRGPAQCTWRPPGGGAQVGPSWQRLAGPPGPNPQGPEPGWGKRRLDECARCQVWCTCVPVSWGVVGKQTQGWLGTVPVWTRKWGCVCVRARGYEACAWCSSVRKTTRGLYTDSRACAKGIWVWSSHGQVCVCVTWGTGLSEHMCPWLVA